jgi:glycosyltransferase involved in cell wall biosynthesis
MSTGRYGKSSAELASAMKTIVYIGGFELPDKNAAAQRVRNNAGVLRALGYRVVMLGTSRARPFDRRLHPADAGSADAEAWEVGYPQNGRQWFDTIRADWPLRELAASGAIDPAGVAAVICYNHPALAQWRIARIARGWGAAALADCTEWYARRSWTSHANKVNNLDLPLRMRWVNRRMDGLITTSPYISEFYRPTGLPIVEIPTLMEEPDIGPDALTVNRADGVTRLFFAGSGFDPAAVRDSADGLKERVDWVFEALTVAQEGGARFILDLFGLSREQYLTLFPGHAALLETLGEALRFHGRQPRELLLSALTEAHFSIFFRKRTRTTLAGFPGKFSESIAYGTPVLTNDMPSTRKYLEEGRTGFTLDPRDPRAAGARLAEIFAMEDDRLAVMKQSCASSRQFAAESYIEPVRNWLAAIGL